MRRQPHFALSRRNSSDCRRRRGTACGALSPRRPCRSSRGWPDRVTGRTTPCRRGTGLCNRHRNSRRSSRFSIRSIW
jgi:hypothetical protein